MPKLHKYNRPLIDRFIENIHKTNGCWTWLGASLPTGYGVICSNYKKIYAHRLSYVVFNGGLKDGDYVLHKCDTPACVNPEHLFVGTQTDNMRDMNKKGRHAKGEDVGRNKLVRVQVVEIKKLYKNANPNMGHIAKAFGVSRSTICMIKNRKIWRHIDEDGNDIK